MNARVERARVRECRPPARGRVSSVRFAELRQTPMKRSRFWYVAAALLIVPAAAAAVVAAGCDEPAPARNGQQKQPARQNQAADKPLDYEWSAEEIAADTQAYLAWSDRRIADQIAQRERRLRALAKRRGQIEQRQRQLSQNLADVRNVRERLRQAYRRAEDEDRWPVRMGGRTFERDRARAILEQTEQYLEDRKPLADAYAEAMGKMSSAEQALKRDVSQLNRLRERVALDLERVRLNQGMAELDQLRKNEAELEQMARTLASMSDVGAEATTLPADARGRETIDVEELLK